MQALLEQRLSEATAFARSLVEREEAIRPNLRGACAIASAWLMDRLQKDGLQAAVVVCQAHCYVRVGRLMLDPTATQFGIKPFVSTTLPERCNCLWEYEEREVSDSLDELMNLMDNSGWAWDAERIYRYVVKGEAA